MEYQDAVRTLNTLQTNASYLEQVKRQRSDPQAQLEAMEMYLARSGLQVEDLNRLNIIHVTGTKGKGSTCAFTERILRNYGLKTGFFSSPHMVQVRERIRINGKPISPELFTKHFWCLYNQLEEFKVLWLGTGEGPSPCGVRGSGPDWLLLCAGRQPCLHALLLPLPHTHGLPCLPPREGGPGSGGGGHWRGF